MFLLHSLKQIYNFCQLFILNYIDIIPYKTDRYKIWGKLWFQEIENTNHTKKDIP
jgi:hypothetical protein